MLLSPFFAPILFLFLALMAVAIPLDLGRRAGAKPRSLSCTKSTSPCVCNGEIGLRQPKLNCPDTTFSFKDRDGLSDASIDEFKSKKAAVLPTDCDHIVELQFISRQITPDMCTDLRQNNNQKMRAFIDFINDGQRLVNVEHFVNIAKGGKFRDPPTAFGAGTSNKTALGLANYLQLVEAKAKVQSDAIDKKMDSLLDSKTQRFSNFESKYTAALKDAIKRSKSEAPKLDNDTVVTQRRNDNKAKAAAKKAQKQQPPPPAAGKKRPAPGSTASSKAKKMKVSASRPILKPATRKPKKP